MTRRHDASEDRRHDAAERAVVAALGGVGWRLDRCQRSGHSAARYLHLARGEVRVAVRLADHAATALAGECGHSPAEVDARVVAGKRAAAVAAEVLQAVAAYCEREAAPMPPPLAEADAVAQHRAWCAEGRAAAARAELGAARDRLRSHERSGSPRASQARRDIALWEAELAACAAEIVSDPPGSRPGDGA